MNTARSSISSRGVVSRMRMAYVGVVFATTMGGSTALAQSTCPIGGDDVPTLAQWGVWGLLLVLLLMGILRVSARRGGPAQPSLDSADGPPLGGPSLLARTMTHTAMILSVTLALLVSLTGGAGAQVQGSQCIILNHPPNTGDVECTSSPLQCWSPKTYFSVTVEYKATVGIPNSLQVEGLLYCGTLKASCASASGVPTCHDHGRRSVSSDDTARGFADVSLSGNGGGFDAWFVTQECE